MRNYCYFPTAIGPCGLLWNETAIERVQLPEKTPAEARRRLTDQMKPCQEVDLSLAPAWVQDAAQRLQTLLLKGQMDLSSIPIDISRIPPFFRQVYEAARRIPPGQTSTYGALALAVGSPGAARAVGQAMGKNPLPLIIPCHRVMAAGGKPGGFSAFGGLMTKQQILAIETAGSLDWHQDFAGASAHAVAYLKKQDDVLASLIERVGDCRLVPKRGTSVFAALVEAIIYQQLHGKAAATIFGRFRSLYPEGSFPSPEAVLKTPEDTLRSVGVSRSKMLSILDLADRVNRGLIPEMSQLAGMSDQAVIDALTQVRGIGPWTAEMLLIFDLGRLDILPVTDYGVRKGFALTYRKRELPSPETLLRHGERWKPFRSLASWYLWRALDLKTS
ncbi:MAG TPA: methylated-DNA--[protein]-cysteine S-methyltransferase [Oligoflexus sp.]|uniref:methylated-DNA--[protein]-cysteine S-methyltransferase n=1 Tax=Oligoflexus sp. TaxID=1971216 RepID=UPI002D521E45|nr:methylated-DNA--[protein]-cysteine S-methyltransferase [Oligoflexus sp.]HYX33078.1 methylated-DNA--[protein]-cysteine S-methyltransferase [Oligoflexus sp.]